MGEISNLLNSSTDDWRFLDSARNDKMLIETHAHLDYPDFANDLDDVLRRAIQAGVTRIVAEAIAAARAVPFEEIAEATTETAEKFFRFNRK